MITEDHSGWPSLMLASTIGHAVLIETLKMAAFYINHSSQTSFNSRRLQGEYREAKSCYLYVQGTGLHIIINRFGLAYDADQIQNVFNYCIRHT